MNTRIESKGWYWSVVAASTLIALAPMAAQGIAYGSQLLRCHRCGNQCETRHLVEKTIMVPKKVVEQRGKNCVVTKEEVREEKYTVFVMKPDTRAYKQKYCYLDDEVKEQEVTIVDPKLVKVPVHRTNHIKVPSTVCVEETRCHQECSICGPVCVCKTCPVDKTYLHDGTSEQDYSENQLVFDKRKCTIFYCVKTPKSIQLPCAEENIFKLVPEERTRKVTVCVPKIEKQNVEVEVTRMVPCKVWVCVTCCSGH